MPATQEEVMKIKGSRRIVRRLGLALAVAAVFAPSAQAMPLDMPPRGLESVQTRLYADDIHVATPVISSPVRLYADDLHAPAVVPVAETHGRGYAPINTSAQLEVVSPAEVVASPRGFDWGDAVIGGTFGLALALLGTGAILIAHRSRSTPKTA
jgi:hypothetical protein